MAPGTKKQRRIQEPGPVIVLQGHKHAAPFDISDENLFHEMIAPLSSNDFLANIFRKKALCVQNDASIVADIVSSNLYDLNPAALMNETSSDHVFVWLKQSDGKIASLEMQDVEQAIALHRVGHATYCRAPPAVEQPMVYHLLRGTGLGCGAFDPTANNNNSLGRGEVEVFIATNKHTTDWHYDFQENFTLQLSGTKRWTLQASNIKYPLRGCTPHYASPDTVESQLKAAHLADATFAFGPPDATNSLGSAQSLTLTPGDMLYFPAGMWHKVETLEPGVSINVSLMSTNYAAITAQAIHHFLLQDDSWRETIVTGPTADGRGQALRHLERLLKDLPAKIEAFATHYGADAILPPVLTFPPKLQLDQENEEEDTERTDVSEEDYEFHNKVEMDEDDTETDTKLAEMFACQVVPVLSFERPTEWSLHADLVSEYVRNPLAHLVPIEHVTNYYDPYNDSNGKYWLLNVNYAGNEMHDSSVRVIFRDETNPLDLISERVDCRLPSFCAKMECFLYYGLFIPK